MNRYLPALGLLLIGGGIVLVRRARALRLEEDAEQGENVVDFFARLDAEATDCDDDGIELDDIVRIVREGREGRLDFLPGEDGAA